MNLGFSGPIREREEVVEKDRRRWPLGHLRRARAPIELLGNDEAIIDAAAPAQSTKGRMQLADWVVLA